ncbi:MFS transporter [Nocardiopsis sp. CC223A]|uniref:MFS transporter n=1 Tax=Nocardiopsis sp. CC223A TaxID=3044051 RepID=UPI00278C7C66|nr:MFS transporter [Nocardiopsis sp. CC223A]
MTSLSAAVMTLDATVLNVALPGIGDEFAAPLGHLQWVVNGYTLAFAALLLTAGSLSDRLGRRGAFAAGMAVFTLASLACALAPGSGWLVAARIVQGAGAAFVFGTGPALIAGAHTGLPESARRTAMGIFAAGGAAAAALGPLVGGVLVEFAGWRSLFLVNLPVGALAVACVLLWTLPQPRSTGGRVDAAGAVLAVALLFALNYGLLTGSGQGWERPDAVAALVACPVLLAVFLLVERSRGDGAMLDLSLFRIPTFVGAIGLSFAARVTSFGMFPFLILWLTGVVGLGALQVGLVLLLMPAGIFLLAPLGGLIARSVPVRVIMAAGMALIGAGLVWAALALDQQQGWAAIAPGLLLVGVGAGLITPHMMDLAVSVVPPERAGMASGTANTFFPLGTAVGVAVFGAVVSAVVGARVAEPGRATAGDFTGLAGAAAETARAAYADGLALVLLVAAATAFACALSSLVLIRARDVHGNGAGGPR